MAPHMLFGNSIPQLQVISTISERIWTFSQQKTLVNVGGPHKDEEGVECISLDSLEHTDDTLRYLSYVTFHRLRSPVLDYNFY